jgi:hypothetical protein
MVEYMGLGISFLSVNEWVFFKTRHSRSQTDKKSALRGCLVDHSDDVPVNGAYFQIRMETVSGYGIFFRVPFSQYTRISDGLKSEKLGSKKDLSE